MLQIAKLGVAFGRPDAPLWVVRGVSFDVEKGEILGVVGESGSGKSVTFLATLGLLGNQMQHSGSVHFDGHNLLELDEPALTKIRGKRIAMIFQDPMSSLNPVLTVGRQLTEALALHQGLTGAAAKEEARRLLSRVGLSDTAQRLKNYPHELSGGMNQRVMIAMSIAGKPELIIADEPTTALDVTIQAQILDLLIDIVREEGASLVLITHDLGVVAETCDRVAVMYAGRVVETGTVKRIFEAPAHPYTRGLLNCIPALEGDASLHPIEGSVPDPQDFGDGCTFAGRCADEVAQCRSNVPPFTQLSASHRAACFNQRGPST